MIERPGPGTMAQDLNAAVWRKGNSGSDSVVMQMENHDLGNQGV